VAHAWPGAANPLVVASCAYFQSSSVAGVGMGLNWTHVILPVAIRHGAEEARVPPVVAWL
jgi:hypothetical protein